jgi:hypothetical protein
MIPKYLTEESNAKKGRKQEKKATQQINSGTLYFSPRDLVVKETDEDYLVDTKLVVTQKSITLKLDDVEKFHRQAKLKTPVYLIYLGNFIIKAVIQRR